MSNYRELLIGCGAKRCKDLRLPTAEEIRRQIAGKDLAPNLIQEVTGLRRFNPNAIPDVGFRGLMTLDNNPDHKPDILFDLTDFVPDFDPERYEMTRKGHFNSRACDLLSSSYDEIHAYEVLEHIGAQGDAKAFFAQFTEFHRILKPDGLFFATCPSWKSMWAWGDPSHTRVITAGTLSFLSQAEYIRQVGKTPMSDFRHIYKADFEPVYVHEDENYLGFVLRALK